MTRCLLGYTTRRPSFFVTRDSYGDLDFKSYFQPETWKKKKNKERNIKWTYITLFLITKHIIFGPKTQNQIEAKNIPEISSMFSYINKGVA
jgi:hypothetical protein